MCMINHFIKQIRRRKFLIFDNVCHSLTFCLLSKPKSCVRYYKFDLDSCISSPIEMSVVKTVLFCLVLKVIRFVLLVVRKRAVYKLIFNEREKERVEFECYLLHTSIFS